MRTPMAYLADDIAEWSTRKELHPGCWSLARPESWTGLNLRQRFKLAWTVFTGRCDALKWDTRASQGEGRG